MPKFEAKVAVLGAGPAGSIAARQLGLAGVDTLLIDPLQSPLGHRLESFPPSGAPLADDIGLLETICGVSEGPAASLHMGWRKETEVRTFDGHVPRASS